MTRSIQFAFLFLGLVLPLAPAFAQAPELGGLLPAGGTRGQTTRVRIDGKNLGGARLYLTGAGVSVKSLQVTPAGDQLTAEIAVAPGALLGPHEVRIATNKGVSNGARFWVDVVPNRVIEHPMLESMPPLLLDGAAPVVLNGRIAVNAGRDRFLINANAGDTWTFDCYADRIRSRFDPVLELKDEAGISLKLVQSAWESDPRFCYRFAKAGKYTLTVRDSEYHGGSNHTYRLLAGRMGYLESYSPRGERPGHEVQLSLLGTNLPAAHATVTIPVGTASGMYWAEVGSGSGMPMLIPLMVETDPVLEAGDTATARPLSALPTSVDGVFGRSSRARFTFHAPANAKYLLDLMGRRIGSRIDGEIRMLDRSGKEIAANDDAPGLGKEARLEFTAPSEGDYTVEVRNVEEVTGSDCFYRLRVEPVVPDFRLAIETDRFAVSAGSTMALTINAERLGGYNGPIEIKATGLPAGVVCTGGVIPAGKSSVEITLTAPLNAVISAADIHLMGEAAIGGKPVTREAPAWERYEHRSIDLLLSVEYSYTRPHHLWEMLLLAVTDRADPITVTTTPTALTLAPGGTVEIPVHIVRQANMTGEVKLDLRGMPGKVTAAPAVIPANQTEGKIILTAAPDAAPDISNVIIQAHINNATLLAPAIRLSLRKN